MAPAVGNFVGQPLTYFVLEPTNSAHADLDAVREPAFGLEPVYERAPKAGYLANLLQSQDSLVEHRGRDGLNGAILGGVILIAVHNGHNLRCEMW